MGKGETGWRKPEHQLGAIHNLRAKLWGPELKQRL